MFFPKKKISSNAKTTPPPSRWNGCRCCRIDWEIENNRKLQPLIRYSAHNRSSIGAVLAQSHACASHSGGRQNPHWQFYAMILFHSHDRFPCLVFFFLSRFFCAVCVGNSTMMCFMRFSGRQKQQRWREKRSIFIWFYL